MTRFARLLPVLLLACAPPARALDYVFATGFESDAAAQLAVARALPDGSADVAVPEALVTFLKPALGTEPAGFFVQATPAGPALFVAVDPASLVPAPAPGDRVSLTVTQLATVGGMRRATAIAGYVRHSGGHALGPYLQDVSTATDLTSAVADYEAELVAVTGTIASAFLVSGAGHVAAGIDTPGSIGNANLKLRAPSTLVDTLGLGLGCTFAAGPAPLWRFDPQVQVSPYRVGELAAVQCPAPSVASASALSPTSVQVVFTRELDAQSVAPDASQFSIDNGLVASAAAVDGERVTLTTTPQAVGTTYTVTVAGSVTDTLGTPVAAPDAATFPAFVTPAAFVINEVNPAILNARDLVELRATAGGHAGYVELVEINTGTLVLATLPGIAVATGDLVVVHLNPPAAAPPSETTGKNQYPSATFADNYDNAWDVQAGTAGITYTNRVLALRDTRDGTLLDAVPFAQPGNTSLAAFPTNVQSLQSAGHWLPANCGGVPCTYATTPSVIDISVNWAGAGTSAAGFSIARKPIADGNQSADWNGAAPNSFGAPNP